MTSEEFEKLIVTTLDKMNNFQNYNKPAGEILTCCQLRDNSIVSKIAETPSILICDSMGKWSLIRTKELNRALVPSVRMIFYCGDQRGTPCPEDELIVLSQLNPLYSLHTSCLEKANKASEDSFSTFGFQSALAHNRNLCLLQTFVQSRIIQLLKRGNCGDLCRVTTDFLLREYADLTHQIIPMEIIMAKFNDFSHVFLIINRAQNSTLAKPDNYGENAWIVDLYNKVIIKAKNLMSNTEFSCRLVQACLSEPFQHQSFLDTRDIRCTNADTELSSFFDPRVREAVNTVLKSEEFKQLHEQSQIVVSSRLGPH